MNVFSIRNTFFIFLVLFTFGTFARQQKIDSLKSLIRTLPDDTVKASVMVSLAERLHEKGENDEAIFYVKKILQLPVVQNECKFKGDAWLIWSHAKMIQSQFDSALLLAFKAWPCYEKIKYIKGQIRFNCYVGQTYDLMSRYDSAMTYFRKALAIGEKNATDVATLASIHNSLGVTSFNRGSYEIAIDHYFKALHFSEEIKNKRQQGAIHNNLGAVHVRIGNYQQALVSFLKLLDIARELNNPPAIALALSNAGECLTQLGDYAKAEKFLDEAIALRTQLKDNRGLAYTRTNAAILLHRKKQLSEAKEKYLQALELARPFNDNELLLSPLAGFAKVNIEMKDTRQAAASLAEGLTIARKIGSKLWEEKLYRLSSELDSARGDFRGAYSWYKKYSALHDSLFNEQKSLQVEEVTALYESEKKDKEIQLLNEVKKREELKHLSDQKIYITAGFVFTVLLFCMVYWLLTKIRTEHILKRQKQEVTRANEEMRVLIGKVEEQNDALAIKNEKLEDLHREKDGMIGIVAHDLRSPLNKVAGLAELIALTGETNKEQKLMIDRIKKVCDDGNGLIRDLVELHHVENQVETSAMSRFEMKSMLRSWMENYSGQLQKKNLHLQTDLESERPLEVTSDPSCLTRVLDNLMSNAIKFSPLNKNIYLQLRTDKDAVKIKIQDEGQGFQPQDMPHLFKKFKKLSARPTAGEHSTGLGLSIVKALLQKMKGHVEVQSSPGQGATFIITLPLETQPVAEVIYP